MCVCVCVSVCVSVRKSREMLKINREIRVNLCFIQYQRKTWESQEVQTFAKHVSTTQDNPSISNSVIQRKKANSTVSHHQHTLYIQYVSCNRSDQNCNSVPKILTTVHRASDCVAEFQAVALNVEGILPCNAPPLCCISLQSSVLYMHDNMDTQTV